MCNYIITMYNDIRCKYPKMLWEKIHYWNRSIFLLCFYERKKKKLAKLWNHSSKRRNFFSLLTSPLWSTAHLQGKLGLMQSGWETEGKYVHILGHLRSFFFIFFLIAFQNIRLSFSHVWLFFFNLQQNCKFC